MPRRKLTEEEKEERRRWRKMPWTTKSFVLLPDGGRRPYDPARDLLDHIVRPELKYFYGETVTADWKPEYKKVLAEMDRQAEETKENQIFV